MKAPKPGTICARMVELLRARPNLSTAELAEGLGVPTDRLHHLLREGDGTLFLRGERVRSTGRASYRWSLLDSSPSASPPDPSAPVEGSSLEDEKRQWMKDEEELREWRSQVENALGLDEDDHTPIKATLKRVAELTAGQVLLAELLKSLGATRENAVDVLEELQRQAGPPTPGGSPTPSSPARRDVRSEIEADTWRLAHAELARQLVEGARR